MFNNIKHLTYYSMFLISFCFSYPVSNFLESSLYEPSPKASILCLTMENSDILPRHFRTTHDSFPLALANGDHPTRLGLNELDASGSGQFSEKSLLKLVDSLPITDQHLIIVDLREEAHGFINSHAVTWRGENDWENIHKTPNEIFTEESKRLNQLLHDKIAVIQIDKDHIMPSNIRVHQVRSAQTESELMATLGLDYYHLTLTDHMRPLDSEVDTFLEFAKNLPEKTWLHFHCAAGKGRTSTFLTMYDMMFNAKQVSLHDIFERQAYLGGKNFNEKPNQYIWKYPLSRDRIIFLRNFYQYCLEKDESNLSWSAWIHKANKLNQNEFPITN